MLDLWRLLLLPMEWSTLCWKVQAIVHTIPEIIVETRKWFALRQCVHFRLTMNTATTPISAVSTSSLPASYNLFVEITTSPFSAVIVMYKVAVASSSDTKYATRPQETQEKDQNQRKKSYEARISSPFLHLDFDYVSIICCCRSALGLLLDAVASAV